MKIAALARARMGILKNARTGVSAPLSARARMGILLVETRGRVNGMFLLTRVFHLEKFEQPHRQVQS
jgi:hypothetical protein